MTIHVGKPSASLSAAQGGTAGRPFVLALQGFVCDRYTSAGMHGALQLARAAAVRLNAPLSDIGEPEPAKNLGWRESLAKAAPYLCEVAGHVEQIMRRHGLPFIFSNRRGASLATIIAMLRYRPDAKIVWFDAHGDFNTPETTPTGYLGGMVLSALCGLWESGFDAGLSPDRIILAGTRDLDPGESRLTAAHGVRVIAMKDGAIDAKALLNNYTPGLFPGLSNRTKMFHVKHFVRLWPKTLQGQRHGRSFTHVRSINCSVRSKSGGGSAAMAMRGAGRSPRCKFRWRTRQLIEEGRRHLLLGDAIYAHTPVHILQGMQDKYVPWTHAMVLAEKITSEPVSLTLIKHGDHRLSREEDLASL